MVEQTLDVPCRHASFLHKVEKRTGIERPGASSHHQPIQGCEAHGTGNASSITHGAQAGAVAEVRNDESSTTESGFVLTPPNDILIGQPVKAVAPNHLLRELPRQSELLNKRSGI